MPIFRTLILFLGFTVTCGNALAQPRSPLDTASAQAERSLQNLRLLEERIENERAPLVEKIDQLQMIVAARRTELLSLQDANQQLLDTIQLKEHSQARESKALDSIRTLFSDLLRDFESHVHPAILYRYDAALRNARSGQTEALIAFLELSSDAFQIAISPQPITVEALDPEGIVRRGQALILGPLGFFFQDQTLVGLLYPDFGLRPRMTPLDGLPAIRLQPDLSQPQLLTLPVDLSLGGASLTQLPWYLQLLQHLALGGVWIYPILTLAALSLIVIFFKSIQFARLRVSAPLPSRPALYPGAPLPEWLETMPPFPARIVQATLELPPHATEGAIAENLGSAVLQAQSPLERGLAILSITAATAPLLGLLGTVTGIIQTFQVIAASGAADPQGLSGGISEALVSTEVGLVVAIPALIAHAFFSRRVQGSLQRLDDFASKVQNLSTTAPSP
ncbi:MAG: MotA/TolQ/ExbB proton channel family protein [Puniceicoccaceae bacterium]